MVAVNVVGGSHCALEDLVTDVVFDWALARPVGRPAVPPDVALHVRDEGVTFGIGCKVNVLNAVASATSMSKKPSPCPDVTALLRKPSQIELLLLNFYSLVDFSALANCLNKWSD